MNRGDIELFYDLLISSPSSERTVNKAFDSLFAQFLSRYPDAVNKYNELKKRNGTDEKRKLLISLSHKIMDSASEPCGVKHMKIDNRNFSINMADLIAAIYDTSEKQKLGVVDALCALFGIPPHTVEPPPQSRAKFLDLAKKIVGYVAVFSSRTASLVTAINLVFGILRYSNDAKGYASSRIAVEMICCTVLTSICANVGRGYDKCDSVNIMGLVCKGLCISLSHYAASWPFLANNLAATGSVYDAGPRFMLNFHQKQANEATYGTSDTRIELHHTASFILSTIWPLMTYMAYFGSNIWKNLAMLAYFHTASCAFMAHKIPRGGPVGALSLVTLSRPDLLYAPYAGLIDQPSPEAIDNAIKSQHAADLITFKAAGWRRDNSRATLGFHPTSTMTVKEAELYALTFLDIMKTYLRLWRRPLIADAFDVLGPSSNSSFLWSAAVMMNSWSVAPCIQGLRSMHGYDKTEMIGIAKNAILSQFANRELFPHTPGHAEGDEGTRLAEDLKHNINFDSIATLLKPTIEGFLYGYMTRNFGPKSGGIGCLGLDRWKPSVYDTTTLAFLNHMDTYFFKALKTELGITTRNEYQLQGATRFYEYTRPG